MKANSNEGNAVTALLLGTLERCWPKLTNQSNKRSKFVFDRTSSVPPRFLGRRLELQDGLIWCAPRDGQNNGDICRINPVVHGHWLPFTAPVLNPHRTGTSIACVEL